MLRRAALFLMLALLTSPLAADDTGRIVIATEGHFPPFNAIDDLGQPLGFEIDLGNAICIHAGLRCDWVVRDWESLIPEVTTGGCDAVMAGMSITPERRKLVDFTREYFLSGEKPQGMFVGMNSFLNPSSGLVAVQKGTIHEDHLRAHDYRVALFETAGAAYDAVLAGKADLVFGSPNFLEQEVLRSGRLVSIIDQVEIDAGGPAIALAHGRTDLRATFNAALDALEADGTIEKLRKKWFTPTREI